MHRFSKRILVIAAVIAAVLLPVPGTAQAEWSSATALKSRTMSKTAFAHPGAWADLGNPIAVMARRSEAAASLSGRGVAPEVLASSAGTGVKSGCLRRSYGVLADHIESALPSKQKLFVVDEATLHESPKVLELVGEPSKASPSAVSAAREARIKYDDNIAVVTLPDGRVEQFEIPAPADAATIQGHALTRQNAMNRLVKALLLSHERPLMVWAGTEKGYVIVNAAHVFPPGYTRILPRRSRELLALQ